MRRSAILLCVLVVALLGIAGQASAAHVFCNTFNVGMGRVDDDAAHPAVLRGAATTASWRSYGIAVDDSHLYHLRRRQPHVHRARRHRRHRGDRDRVGQRVRADRRLPHVDDRDGLLRQVGEHTYRAVGTARINGIDFKASYEDIDPIKGVRKGGKVNLSWTPICGAAAYVVSRQGAADTIVTTARTSLGAPRNATFTVRLRTHRRPASPPR